MVGWSYKWPAVPLNAISQNQTVVSCRFVIHFYACMISFLCSLEMRNYDSIAITSGCSYSNPFQRRAREKLTYTLRTAASVDNYTRTKFNEPAWYLQELPWRKHTFRRNTLFRRWLRDTRSWRHLFSQQRLRQTPWRKRLACERGLCGNTNIKFENLEQLWCLDQT